MTDTPSAPRTLITDLAAQRAADRNRRHGLLQTILDATQPDQPTRFTIRTLNDTLHTLAGIIKELDQ